MLDLLRTALEFAAPRCDQVELYGEKGDVLSIELERDEVKTVRYVKSIGIGVRVVIANKIGFAHTTAVKQPNLEECVTHAIKHARVSEYDEHFRSLPSPQIGARGYRTPEKTFDRTIIELLGAESGSDVAMGYCKEMLAGTSAYTLKPGIECEPTEGSFTAGYDEIFIVNSEGVEIQDSGTYASAGMSVVARDGLGEETSGYESDVSRLLNEVDFGAIGTEAVRLAAESLGGKAIQTKKLPVVFSPHAVQSLFAYTLIPQLSAEMVQRKQSPYYGRKGETIASEMLAIVDDGTMPLGVNTRKMDGEGVPTQSTTLLAKGVLTNFFYDTYTSAKDQVESTGNALRGFSSLPVPGPTNFILKAAEGDAIVPTDELLSNAKEGLFVHDVIGAHTASRASGDFSVVVQNAVALKKGDSSPVKHAMIAGNSQELLKHVELLGDDTQQIYTVVSPSMLISAVQVIG
ncbi:MAG: TldD/PmbA family protein [Methanomicrobia archaeon]|nr:TldD/PmbA family protein [Methanomicrobia archaeon]